MFDDTGGSMWHILVRWGLDHLLVDPGLDHSTADPCLESSWSNRSDSSEVFWALKATCKFSFDIGISEKCSMNICWSMELVSNSLEPAARSPSRCLSCKNGLKGLRSAAGNVSYMEISWKYHGNIRRLTFKSVMYPSYKSQHFNFTISLILAKKS